ncbi:MAG TPA: glycosyltransferase N-terminal domain-containing protein [Pseudobdellovibrionaceae bacterium]|nr:glycosyltransferase N-terminal domain-containing protein [Pseudobdellovibrionaceae bacterium]
MTNSKKSMPLNQRAHKERLIHFIFLSIYNYFLIPLAQCLLPLVSLFIPKVKEISRQQKNIWERLDPQLLKLKPGPRLWFHVSSAGEFLQAKPVIESLKKLRPELQILLTYVSPSATKWVQNFSEADLIEFYPFDSKKNVRRLLDLFKPQAVVLVKFDLWPNLIVETSKRKIPSLLISATLTETSKRFSNTLARWFFKSIYDHLSRILTVSEKDAQLFLITNPHHQGISVCGDTRTDSVLQRQAFFASQELSPFFQKLQKIYYPILVAGSTWPEDEKILTSAWKQFILKIKPSHQVQPLLILVPHEPLESHLLHIESLLKQHQLSFVRWTHWINKTSDTKPHEDVLIFNQVGGLAQLYRISNGAYVGSGNGGVHNTMEPAAWSLPVLFRNTYQNAPEAVALVQQNIFQVVHTSEELTEKLNQVLLSVDLQNELGSAARQYLEKSQGAAEKSAQQILQLLNFSNRPY